MEMEHLLPIIFSNTLYFKGVKMRYNGETGYTIQKSASILDFGTYHYNVASKDYASLLVYTMYDRR